MLRKIYKRFAIAASLCAFSSAAFATYSCQGTIASVSLNQGGIVTISSPASGLGTFYVCQIGSTTNGIGPEQCKAMLAMLYVARSTGQQVQWTFDDSLNCTSRPSWSWLAGWYFGPTIMD